MNSTTPNKSMKLTKPGVLEVAAPAGLASLNRVSQLMLRVRQTVRDKGVCYFITGTLPTGVNLAAIRAIPGVDGSAWLPLANPSVARQLPGGADYYLVTGSVCDCTSGLVKHLYRRFRSGERVPKGVARWSAAKQQRWHEQRSGAGFGDGNLSLWATYLARLAEVAHPGSIGIMVHWYGGAVAEEEIKLRVVPPVSSGELRGATLASWLEDVLYQVAAPAGVESRGCRTSG